MFHALRYQADLKTWSRLDAGQYGEDEISIVKIPMALPYPVKEGVYQAMQDNFEYDGVYYKGIKQKMENDTLFVVCVKDQCEKNLNNVMTRYEKVISDTPSKSKTGQSLLSKLLKEYETFCQPKIVHQSGWILTLPYWELTANLAAVEPSVQSPPPWQLS